MEHYPENSFISEEVSARFPEDGCIVHTIALDITEEQHREIQRLRRNVYELIGYMDQSEIEYYWCHPSRWLTADKTKYMSKIIVDVQEPRAPQRNPLL